MSHPVDQIYISPTTSNPFIFCVLAEHQIGFNRSQGCLTILKQQDAQFSNYFSQVIEKAQDISIISSPDGTSTLIQTSTLHDETGNSYYGLHKLMYFNPEQKKLTQVYCPQGPIHDVAWSPNSKNFIVISGFMPATAVLYKKDCTPLFEFGKHHRNTIRWSPFSRFVMLGGFGNLSGDMDFWDLTQMKVVGSIKSPASLSHHWSPDGR